MSKIKMAADDNNGTAAGQRQPHSEEENSSGSGDIEQGIIISENTDGLRSSSSLVAAAITGGSSTLIPTTATAWPLGGLEHVDDQKIADVGIEKDDTKRKVNTYVAQSEDTSITPQPPTNDAMEHIKEGDDAAPRPFNYAEFEDESKPKLELGEESTDEDDGPPLPLSQQRDSLSDAEKMTDADADINRDIENQTQTTQPLIEAYTVPDDDEQAEIIDQLHEQLARTQTKLELEQRRSQLWEEVSVVEGVPISDILDSHKKKQRFITIGVVLFLGMVAIAVGLAFFFTNKKSYDDGYWHPTPTPEAAAKVLPPVLEALQERKVLRCGTSYDQVGFSVINDETNEWEGFEIDLCKAVAAAALGSSYRYELAPVTRTNRFVKLANGEFDVLISITTHTFERDVHEVSSGIGFSFSTPYLYGGMTFNGVPEFVTCADKLSVIGECASIRICSCIGTTWYDKTENLFPASKIVVTEDQQESIKNLVEGKCNVIQGEQYEAPEPVVRGKGYDGPYAQGVNAFTKEPLAIVTRDGDPEFADFAELVLQSLFHAEAQNVTMMTADTFTQTGEIFGDQYEDMFKNALAAVGNYGEIYARHLEPISARLKVNTINHGETGLLYSHPFGKVDTVGPGPIKGGVIESILERGFLRCGIPLHNSNSPSVLEDAQEPNSDERVGLDMEFCRALAASILQSAPDNVSFKSFPASEYRNISLALENGDIDVYAGGEVNMNSNILSPGLSFSRPYFYEGGPSRGNSTAEKAFSLVTKEADAQWTKLVYWVVMATIYAEENGITQTTSNEMPLVSLFGTGLKRLMRDAILAVGNYDEMYRRVFGQNATRVGRNMLNASPFGPEHYPLPFGERLPNTDEDESR